MVTFPPFFLAFKLLYPIRVSSSRFGSIPGGLSLRTFRSEHWDGVWFCMTTGIDIDKGAFSSRITLGRVPIFQNRYSLGVSTYLDT